MKAKELLGELMELNKIGKGDMEVKRFNLSEYGQEYEEIKEVKIENKEVIIN